MFGREVWDKLRDCIFENLEIAKGNFKTLKNREGDLFQKLPKPNMWLLVNHTKPTNTLY